MDPVLSMFLTCSHLFPEALAPSVKRFKGPDKVEAYVRSGMIYYGEIPFLYKSFKPTAVHLKAEKGGYKVVSVRADVTTGQMQASSANATNESRDGTATRQLFPGNKLTLTACRAQHCGGRQIQGSGWSRGRATGGAMELRSQDPVARRIL